MSSTGISSCEDPEARRSPEQQEAVGGPRDGPSCGAGTSAAPRATTRAVRPVRRLGWG